MIFDVFSESAFLFVLLGGFCVSDSEVVLFLCPTLDPEELAFFELCFFFDDSDVSFVPLFGCFLPLLPTRTYNDYNTQMVTCWQ